MTQLLPKNSDIPFRPSRQECMYCLSCQNTRSLTCYHIKTISIRCYVYCQIHIRKLNYVCVIISLLLSPCPVGRPGATRSKGSAWSNRGPWSKCVLFLRAKLSMVMMNCLKIEYKLYTLLQISLKFTTVFIGHCGKSWRFRTKGRPWTTRT